MRRWEWAAFAICLGLMVWLAAATAGWPFMGDATYLHYVVFLTGKGWRPYRDIVEMNMPGAYLVEWAAISVFGPGAAGWRAFDLLVTAVGIWSCHRLLRRQSRVAGLCAGVCLATVHAQDGVMMAGQRDFVVAVCEVAALACLGLPLTPLATSSSGYAASPSGWRLFCFGVLSGIAISIKPPAVLFLLAVGVWLLWKQAGPGWRVRGRSLAALPAGVAVPALGVLAYLAAHGSVGAFRSTLHGLVAYHAQLERKPLSFLLTHAVSPVMPLFVLGLAAGLTAGRHRQWPLNGVLLLTAGAGWASYLVQGKGFSYQRYPFLIFALLLVFSWIFAALESSGMARWLARAGAATALAMMGLFTWQAASYSHEDPFLPLTGDLRAMGGAGLSGSVQCMDTAGGCIAALYNERLVQSTGFIYDCYFEDAGNSVAQELRRRFEEAIRKNPPRVYIITDSVCFGQPKSFDKFASWPEFTEELAGHYRLVQERHFTRLVRYWSRKALPFSYRIYERNGP